MMTNPPHPGQSVKVACLVPNDLSVTDGAKVLGVGRLTLSNLVNGKNGITADMAIRLEKAFGGTAHGWLAVQAAYNLAKASKKALKIKVKPFKESCEVYS